MKESFTLTSESENLYNSLFEKSPVCMYIFDPETYRILDVNETFLDSFGYTREEFLKMALPDFRPAEDVEKIRPAIDSLRNDFKKGVVRLIKKNKEIVSVEMKAAKILYKGNTAILSIPEDITERVNREEEILKLNSNLIVLNEDLRKNIDSVSKLNDELKLNELRLKSAQEAGKSGCWEYNVRSRLYYCSDELYKVFDLPVEPQPVKENKFADKIHPDDLHIIGTANQRAALYGEPIDCSYRIFIKDNEIRHIYTKGEVKLGNDGKPYMVIGISMDITEHVKTREELTQQINNINIILSSITDPFYIIDRDYNFIFLNDAVEKLSGFKREELIGKKVWSIYQNEDFTNARRAFETAYSKNSSTEFQCEYKGRVFYAHAYPSPIGLSVSCADITEKKKIDDELKNTLEFIKEVSANTPGAIYQTVFYPDGRRKLTYVSEYFEEFTGATVEEALEDFDKVSEAVYPDDAERLQLAVADTVRNKTKLDIKYRMVNKKTKKIKWVRSSSMARKMADGSTVVTGVLMDIDESENHYTELEKSNQRYEYISQAANEVIWEYDLGENVLKLGGAYESMFGFSFPDNKCDIEVMKGLVHPDDLEEMEKKQMEAVESGGKSWHDSYRIVKNDGSIIYVNEKAYIVYDEKNNPVKFIGTTQDITELKKIQLEKEKIISDLVNKNRALEEFTHMVSHNLRAPVANIIGLSNIIQDEGIDEATKNEMNELIVKASGRLDEVIKDMNEILDIHKNFSEDKTEIIFEDILDEIKSAEEFSIAKSKVKIISDFSKADSFFSVKSSMQSIFRNLISNSIKFRKEEDAFIKISSSEDDEYIYLNFEDNGIGIDLDKYSDKMFVLYSRFHFDKEGKGTGLFMVKTHVESMGGNISVVSRVNEGTKFFIKLKK